MDSTLGEAIDRVLLETVAGRNGLPGVPGVVAMVTDRRGNIYEGAAGRRSLAGEEPMTADSVLALFFCTKALAGVAVMQLVEEGKLGLDDPVCGYVPEAAEVHVLEGFDANGEPLLRPPKSDFTVGQLLLHTAGFGYDTFNEKLARYGQVRGVPSVITGSMASLRTPLLFDPGTGWEYGLGMDWAGLVVQAVRGERLGKIMRERIFQPLGMADTGFRLSSSMRSRLAVIHQYGGDGGGKRIPTPELELPQEPEIDMGGHGLYGTAGDYMKFIRMLLNDGMGAEGRVLRPETVARMARNGLGTMKIHRLPGVMRNLSNDVEFFPGMPKSWGYTFMINDEDAPTGRPAGQLGWAGLANLFYWIDRRNGLGGFWGTQILPFADPVSLAGYLDFETAVYAHHARYMNRGADEAGTG